MTSKQQLDSFLARYNPPIAALGRAAMARIRRMFPRAVVMVYDNYNALVIGFGPGERASEAAFSIALYPKWVRLFFLEGVTLPDPARKLEGTGKQVRSLVLSGVDLLDQPEVVTLLGLAASQAGIQTGPTPAGKIVIKSVSAKQRPRK
jgi:hypothetical protein